LCEYVHSEMYREGGKDTKVTTRLSVNINDETAEALKELAARRGTTVTEVVRRAVSVYKFVEDEVGDKGKTMQLVDENDRVTTVAMV
jgi:predicted DNA-binding helix-hairpin-helix protein